MDKIGQSAKRKGKAMIAFIWAEDDKGAIGKDNALPWRLPSDMNFFKRTTTGNTVVMGRKTFESMGSRPLPNRRNIVITRQAEYIAGGAEVVHTVNELLDILKTDENVYVIGGKEIFQLLYPFANVLLQTKISGDFVGDTLMSPINWDEWELIKEKYGKTDEKNLHAHVFRKFIRKSVK